MFALKPRCQLKLSRNSTNYRFLTNTSRTERVDFRPITGTESPRYAGIATLMRLPHLTLNQATNSRSGVEIALVGIPWDGGTTNKPGARMGPRSARDASTSIRHRNRASGINPFELCNCADIGDAPVNPLDVLQCLEGITTFYDKIASSGIFPLSVGGDHLVSLPILRALAKEKGPIGLIHFDAHSDMWDSYFGGCRYSHGTGFRRAIEEGLIDPHRTIQIGLRGALYDDAVDNWATGQGVTVIDMDDFRTLGIQAVLEQIVAVTGYQQQVEGTASSGRDPGGVYISFDIDVLDPSFAPGTGTPEIGGMTTYEAQQLIRGLKQLQVPIWGADVVELAPSYDPTSNSSLAAVTMMYEILCIMAENINKNRKPTYN